MVKFDQDWSSFQSAWSSAYHRLISFSIIFILLLCLIFLLILSQYILATIDVNIEFLYLLTIFLSHHQEITKYWSLNQPELAHNPHTTSCNSYYFFYKIIISPLSFIFHDWLKQQYHSILYYIIKWVTLYYYY